MRQIYVYEEKQRHVASMWLIWALVVVCLALFVVFVCWPDYLVLPPWIHNYQIVIN